MPAVRFSKLARLDLIEIADYTVDTWGLEQAIRYLDGLDDCFKQLSETPRMGSPCDQIRSGYRRTALIPRLIIEGRLPERRWIIRGTPMNFWMVWV